MKYHIHRDGRQYGPYSPDEIRNYVDRGSVLTSDLAREESSESWVTVTELMVAAAPPANTLEPAPRLDPIGPGTGAVSPFPNVVADPGHYYVLRDGRQFGPYSPAEIRAYLAQGSLASADLARSDRQADWTPLVAILAGGVCQAMGAPRVANVSPPSLHWAIVLLLSWITWGIFGTVWMFVQSSWVKKIDPHNKATGYYVGSLVFAVLAASVSVPYAFARAIAGENVIGVALLGFLIWLAIIAILAVASCVFAVAGILSMKRAMERYYTATEPIGLRLSGPMMFFFNSIYLQYHFTRIAEWKRTGTLRA
jgi:hypothetical protein